MFGVVATWYEMIGSSSSLCYMFVPFYRSRGFKPPNWLDPNKPACKAQQGGLLIVVL